MRITLKLYAMLTDQLPPEADGRKRKGNELPLELPEGATVQSVIDRFRLPPKLVHLVLINGVYIPPQARTAHALAADDELAIWPPIAGGQAHAGARHVTGDAEEFELERELGCTREEFMRWLPGATRHAPIEMHADKAVVHAGKATVEISFVAAPPRRIALVAIPVLRVSFRFAGANAGAYREFMAYFDLYTRRGGG